MIGVKVYRGSALRYNVDPEYATIRYLGPTDSDLTNPTFTIEATIFNPSVPFMEETTLEGFEVDMVIAQTDSPTVTSEDAEPQGMDDSSGYGDTFEVNSGISTDIPYEYFCFEGELPNSVTVSSVNLADSIDTWLSVDTSFEKLIVTNPPTITGATQTKQFNLNYNFDAGSITNTMSIELYACDDTNCEQ